MSKALDVYLSLISPFSYLTQTQLAALTERTQCSVNYHVLDHGKLFKLNSNPGPISVSAKLKYLGKDLQDWCRYYNVPFNMPSRFPINSRMAAAGAVTAQKAGKLPEFIERVFRAYLVEDQNIADQQVLGKLAAEVGLDAQSIAAGVNDPAILQEVDAKTEAAVKRGVFGVPTFFVGDDMYWGNDRLMFVEQALKR